MRKRYIAIIAAAAAAAICAVGLLSGFALLNKGPVNMNGSTIVIDTKREFKRGEFSGTHAKGADAVTLKPVDDKYISGGTYLSPEYDAKPFKRMLASINGDTPGKTSMKVEVSVRVGKTWSRWLNWGTWGTAVNAATPVNGDDDGIAELVEDVLIIDNDKTADAVKYRVTLNTPDKKLTPSLKLVALSIQNEDSPVARVYGSEYAIKDTKKLLDVPELSQMTRETDIGWSICSPTSVSMVLNYYGAAVTPEECAWGVYDNGSEIFGNWSFNCAYAGSYGVKAYAQYCTSLDDIKHEIEAGYPVVASVYYKNSEDVQADLPVLHGAPIASTGGHLVTVCGFTKQNGQDYLIVNDPAASSDDGVRVEYLASEFMNCWRKVIYVIEKPADTKIQRSLRLEAKLVPVTGQKYTYTLVYKGKTIDVSSDNINTIMFISVADGSVYYRTPTEDGTFLFVDDDGTKYRLIFVTKDGQSYEAPIS